MSSSGGQVFMGVLKYENEYRPHADGFKCSVRRPRRHLLKNRGCRAYDSFEAWHAGVEQRGSGPVAKRSSRRPELGSLVSVLAR